MKNMIIILAVLLSCVVVFAQNVKPQIAVYVTGSIKENDKKALNTEILHALVKSGRYTAIERSKEFLSAVDKEQKKKQSGAVDENQIKELGKQFGVEYICVADITKLSNEFQISTRIVNTKTSAVPVITGKAYSKLKTGSDFEEAANKIIESMFGGRAETDDKIKPAELTSPEAYNDRAIEFDSNGEFDKAIADLSEAIRLAPNAAVYYFNRGIAYSHKKEYYNAIDDYTTALRHNPSPSDLWKSYISRGTAYYRLEDYQRALADFTKGIELDQSSAGAYGSRGDAYRMLKNYDNAIDDYETALRLDPSLAWVRDNLEAVKREKLAALPPTPAKPPTPTMSEFWGSIYNQSYYNAGLNAPYFEQNQGDIASSALAASKTTTDSEEKETRFGIKAAWNPGNSELDMHINGGIFMDIPFTNTISFNPEVSYYYTGEEHYKLGEYPNEADFIFSHVYGLSIPLMLKLYPVSFIYLTAGFNTDLILSGGDYYCAWGSCPDEERELVERSPINFGLVFGGGLLIGNHLLVDFRYIVDLDDADYDGSYSHYELGLGLMF